MRKQRRETRSTSRYAVTAALSILAVIAIVPVGAARADHRVVDRVSSGPADGNSLPEPTFFTISRDGSRSFFVTGEPLVPEDTDAQPDVYQRAAGSTTLLSTGPAGGNGPFPAFPSFGGDPSGVFFYTAEQLTADDTDARRDIYQRVGSTTTRASTGPLGGNGDFDVSDSFRTSADGSSIVFRTLEQLTGDDTNSDEDLYLRAGGQTTLLTGGPVNEQFDSHYVVGLSDDGERIFFSTTRQLASADTDFQDDVYKWEAGATTMQSIGPNGENTGHAVFAETIDAAGRRLIFTTYGRLVPEDVNDWPDVYERAGGTTTHVGPGNGAGISDDGSRVFFLTTERLVAADHDSYDDLYVRAGGATELVSAGPLAVDEDFQALHFGGTTTDGSHAFFTTNERLTPEDTDGTRSAYQYSGGPTARYLAPTSVFPRFSADGSRVFVVTDRALLPSDTDTGCNDSDIVGCEDVYEIHGGEITLVSTGPGDPSSGDAGVCVNRSGFRIVIDCRVAVSADGRRVLFWHNAPLLAGDTDSSYDVYLASTAPRRTEYGSAASFCQAEREFLGVEAFRERYGTGRKGENAFKKCVKSNR